MCVASPHVGERTRAYVELCRWFARLEKVAVLPVPDCTVATAFVVGNRTYVISVGMSGTAGSLEKRFFGREI